MDRYLVIDVETTGLDSWKNEIIELGAIVCDGNLKKLGSFQTYVKPEFKSTWSKEAESVHGITWGRSQGFPSSELALNRFTSFLGAYFDSPGFSFVCHAKPGKSRIDLIDYNFVFGWFWRLDRRKEFYRLFPEEFVRSTIDKKPTRAKSLWGIKNQKLGTWAQKMGKTYNAHTALDDANMCYEVFKYQEAKDELQI